VIDELEGRLIDAVMPAGSALIFPGTLWHRGGGNHSKETRLAVTLQYCAPWARQQENMFLAVPAEITRNLSPRVRALMGYSIHPPFMGHVDSMHPERRLQRP
jgi:ectoine hydroxylase-related dioxygenase (phytanoyl-CoA dioxygenase family)